MASLGLMAHAGSIQGYYLYMGVAREDYAGSLGIGGVHNAIAPKPIESIEGSWY